MLKKTALFALLGVALGASSVGACVAIDNGGAATSGAGGAAGSAVGTGDPDASVDVAPDGEQPTGPIKYTALCGDGACDPADTACVPPMPDEMGGGGAGTGGGGAGGSPPTGCHIVSVGGTPTPTCSATGVGTAQSPCMSDLDCGPGFGCVDSGVTNPEPLAGFCEPYCCGELEDCPTGTYCAPRPHYADLEFEVPVCVPVAPCALLIADACGEGQTCTVVRADGTTSCVPVGEGQLCDPCPCGAGFVCSQSTGTCQQLCHTDGVGECTGTSGTCQGGTNLPSGVGICIGGDADCSH